MRTDYDRAVPFDFDGLSIRELTPRSLQSASIATIDVPPGARHRTARSSSSEKLYVCLEGPLSFVVRDREIELGTLDVLHIPMNEWFSYYNESGNPARLLLIHVPPFDLDSEEFLEIQDNGT
ncbi:MAG: cupin domain-containing protein [Chloroflexi bacterium]|nr:cupin domain-containing protein [Chloroflexota bacterium]